jgi:O-antigen/teichoic acid export membrane protein
MVKYRECRSRLYWDKDLFREIAGYTGWNVIGTVSNIVKNQSIGILINQFFGSVAVAARGIALSVNSVVSSFSINFTMAMHPQIIKLYASGERKEMESLLLSGTKATWFLMYIFTLPLVLEMPMVLSLWLGNPPEYTVLFARLTLIDILIVSIGRLCGSVAHASGNVKVYQIITGSIMILNFPIAWIAFSLGAPVYSVMIIAICMTFLSIVAQIVIIKYSIKLSITAFIKEALFPVFMASTCAAILPVVIINILDKGFLRLCIITLTSIISVCGCVYLLGLNKLEKKQMIAIILTATKKAV